MLTNSNNLMKLSRNITIIVNLIAQGRGVTRRRASLDSYLSSYSYSGRLYGVIRLQFKRVCYF